MESYKQISLIYLLGTDQMINQQTDMAIQECKRTFNTQMQSNCFILFLIISAKLAVLRSRSSV